MITSSVVRVVCLAVLGLIALLPVAPAAAQGLVNDKIVFESGRGGGKLDIFIQNGGAPVNLTNSEDHFDRDPVFDPDGNILFERASTTSNFGIYEVPMTGGTPQLLVGTGGTDYGQPSVAGNNSKIAFGDGTSVYSANRDGSGMQVLAPGRSPDVSPDGAQVVYSHFGSVDVIGSDGTGNSTIFLPEGTDSADWPSFSTDGSMVVFSLAVDAGEELWIVNSDGTNPQRVDVTGIPGAPFYLEPVFSPDGKQILFSGPNSTGAGGTQLYSVPTNGGAVTFAGGAATQVTDSDSGIDGDRNPDWYGIADSAPPETEITTKPEDSISSKDAQVTLSYGFTGSDDQTPAGELSFECSTDGGSSFSACSSPHSYAVATGAGPHEFQVRALDAAGNSDPTPATHTVATELIDCEAVAKEAGDAVEEKQLGKADKQSAKSKKLKKKSKQLAKKARKASGNKAKKLKQQAKKLAKKAKKLAKKAKKIEAGAESKGEKAAQEALGECEADGE